jgi:hypothetical protein
MTLDDTIPTYWNYDYRISGNSQLLGEDVLIRQTDFPFKSNCQSKACNLHIKITTYDIASYTLTIASESSIKLLQMSTPYSSSVAQGNYNYFKSNLAFNNSKTLETFKMRISTTLNSGIITVYSSCTNNNPNLADHGNTNHTCMHTYILYFIPLYYYY